jgi:ABC-type phosphate transport system substrate-binding protein
MVKAALLARFAAVITMAACVVALAAVPVLTPRPALADPSSTPPLTTLTGVGSETLGPLFDNGVPGGDAGSFVHDYNATSPTDPIASWDAVNPSTGVANQGITTKALNPGDTSCQLARPDGSNAGIAALNQNQTDTNTVDGQTVYCIDYARSSRAPDTTSFEDAFITLARDGLDWSYPKVSGEINPQPKTLTEAQLAAIYTCADTNWDQVGGKDAPIGAVVPQPGSGTLSTWLLELGINASAEPCWQNGSVTVNGTADVIEENTGLSAGNVAQFTTTQDFGTTCASGCAPADDIFPYSIGDWIAQGTNTNGVGGHATSVWKRGNLNLGETANASGTAEVAVTKNSSRQPVINPAWNPQFLNVLYGVTRNGCYVPSKPTSTAVCLPSSTPPAGGTAYPSYEVKGLAALFGKSGWICTKATARADIVSYGFTKLSDCGALTAGGGGNWGTAEEVPGTAALNAHGYARITSVSCPTPGNCSAGGWYEDASGDRQAFVVSETGGVWGTAIEVPGTAALNAAGYAGITSVSCASAGNCSAGGWYTDASSNDQAFVVSETGGVWGTAIEVPGTAALNAGGDAQISSVSCASAGNCSAGGYYAASGLQAFVVGETGGAWGTAIEVPGTAALNVGGDAEITSVSCQAESQPATCGAGGWYRDASGLQQAFVVGESSGAWSSAEEVPGTAGLNRSGAAVYSVSCAPSGFCSAGGYYTDASGDEQAFVAFGVPDDWDPAIEVPGTAALNAAGDAGITSVSCVTGINCSAGGFYSNAPGNEQAFVVNENGNDDWGTAIEVPGTAALNAGGNAEINSVSCATAGNCSAGGYYTDASGDEQAFVVDEADGVWGTAIEVPGTAALNAAGDAQITSVSCATAGSCSAGGYYRDASHNFQAFVVGG